MKFLPGVFRLKTRAHVIQVLSYSTTVTRPQAHETRLLLESLGPTPSTIQKRKSINAELHTKFSRWNDRYYLKDVSMYHYAYDINDAPIQLAIVDRTPPLAGDEVTDSPFYNPSAVATSLKAQGYIGSFYSPLAAKVNALEISFAKVYTAYRPWPDYSGQEPEGYAYPAILHIKSTPSIKGVTFDLLLPGPHTVRLFDLFHKIYFKEDAKQALSLIFTWTRRFQMLRFSDTALAIMLGVIIQENRNLDVLEILTRFFRHWSNIDYLHAEAVSLFPTNEIYEDPDKHTYNESPLIVQDPFVSSKNHAERVSLAQLRRFKDASAAALSALEAKEPLHVVLRLERPKPLIKGVSNDDGPLDIEYVHRKFLTLPDEVHRRRRKTLDTVERALQKSFGNKNKVVFFGSVRYGITHAKSDLDMVVLDESKKNGLGPEDQPTGIYNIRKVAEVLRRARFSNILVIARASVPIVKFRDPRTGLECDININERLGLYNSKLVDAYCTLSPLLRPLLMLIKLWAKPLGLNSPSPDMMGVKHLTSFSSYAFALMTISFMQTRGLLPNLQHDLPPLGPDDTNGVFWSRTRKGVPIKCDVRYQKMSDWEPPAYPTLKETLRDWFLYWSHEYQYHKQAASIRHGGLCEPVNNRSELESGKASPEVRPSVITVFDPFIRTKNVTKAITSIVLKRFVDQCREAANVLEGTNSLDELIGRIKIPEASHDGKTKRPEKHKENSGKTRPRSPKK